MALFFFSFSSQKFAGFARVHIWCYFMGLMGLGHRVEKLDLRWPQEYFLFCLVKRFTWRHAFFSGSLGFVCLILLFSSTSAGGRPVTRVQSDARWPEARQWARRRRRQASLFSSSSAFLFQIRRD
ncbi:hypothetical protein BT67DRAFT_306721 [Trichocladium antarcticum]|uniref:Uncharacterized protein n=1 Tax=Trichocladium antarcticum TaxID=1450529 RepID=A0AAN6UJS9_9PEZI|nr:hypothetical protein BT67DRAFT_306721 [Trichocladium antarcticum]